METNFNLNNFNKAIESAKKVRDNYLTDSDVERFSGIVNGISRKYSSQWVDAEDLAQEIWLKTLEESKRCGETLDARQVARMGFNKAVDVYRYERRRYDSKAEFLDEIDEGGSSGATESKLSHSTFTTGQSTAEVKEIINLFEKGTNERKYVLVKAYLFGALDPDIDNQLVNEAEPEMNKIPTMDADSSENARLSDDLLAREVFGQKSGGKSGSFCAMKRTVKSTIKEYLKDAGNTEYDEIK